MSITQPIYSNCFFIIWREGGQVEDEIKGFEPNKIPMYMVTSINYKNNGNLL